MSPAQYELMLKAVEDAEAIAAFDDAMDDGGDNVPWDQALAEDPRPPAVKPLRGRRQHGPRPHHKEAS